MDMKQAAEEAQAERELLNKQVRVEGSSIVLNNKPENTTGDYDIPLGRCDTQAKLLGWVQKLTEKSNITTDMIAHFIRLASDVNKIEIDMDA